MPKSQYDSRDVTRKTIMMLKNKRDSSGDTPRKRKLYMPPKFKGGDMSSDTPPNVAPKREGRGTSLLRTPIGGKSKGTAKKAAMPRKRATKKPYYYQGSSTPDMAGSLLPESVVTVK